MGHIFLSLLGFSQDRNHKSSFQSNVPPSSFQQTCLVALWINKAHPTFHHKKLVYCILHWWLGLTDISLLASLGKWTYKSSFKTINEFAGSHALSMIQKPSSVGIAGEEPRHPSYHHMCDCITMRESSRWVIVWKGWWSGSWVDVRRGLPRFTSLWWNISTTATTHHNTQGPCYNEIAYLPGGVH
jgi:hypothetical protein